MLSLLFLVRTGIVIIKNTIFPKKHIFIDHLDRFLPLKYNHERFLTSKFLLCRNAGEYNSTIPPALSNTLDHFPPSSYAFKPAVLITYSAGMFGGLRASMHLRDTCAELGCIALGSTLTIGQAQKVLDENGNTTEENSPLPGRLQRIITMMEWYGQAMRRQRNEAGVPKL